jgi:hypothetical protein
MVFGRVFIETVLNFLGVSLTLYAVGHLYMVIFHQRVIKPTVRCPYCKQYIGEAVSQLDLEFWGVFGFALADLVFVGASVSALFVLAGWKGRWAGE